MVLFTMDRAVAVVLEVVEGVEREKKDARYGETRRMVGTGEEDESGAE